MKPVELVLVPNYLHGDSAIGIKVHPKDDEERDSDVFQILLDEHDYTRKELSEASARFANEDLLLEILDWYFEGNS